MEDLLIQKDEKSPVTIQISPESPLPNEEEKSPSPKIADPISPSKMPVSAKQILNLNLSKFLTEIGGTAILGVFYSLMGDQQSGLFLLQHLYTPAHQHQLFELLEIHSQQLKLVH